MVCIHRDCVEFNDEEKWKRAMLNNRYLVAQHDKLARSSLVRHIDRVLVRAMIPEWSTALNTKVLLKDQV